MGVEKDTAPQRIIDELIKLSIDELNISKPVQKAASGDVASLGTSVPNANPYQQHHIPESGQFKPFRRGSGWGCYTPSA